VWKLVISIPYNGSHVYNVFVISIPSPNRKIFSDFKGAHHEYSPGSLECVTSWMKKIPLRGNSNPKSQLLMRWHEDVDKSCCSYVFGGQVAQSVEHWTLVRQFTEPWPHARVQVFHRTEFIVCVKNNWPLFLDLGNWITSTSPTRLQMNWHRPSFGVKQ
jgi:hypothetical protein